MLEIKNLTFNYDGKNNILENININVDRNSIVSIIGESGIGKTTLFNLIAGCLKVDIGEIMLDKKPINANEYVSYMLQKDLLFEHKTIKDNVALPLIIKKVPKKEARDKAYRLLKEFNLDIYENKYPSELSGGMRQRVALLRTYMFDRNIILLDEAFSALDTITRNEIYEWYINTSNKLGLTTLLITHDIDEAIFLSDKIYILANKPANVIKVIDIDLEKPRDNETLISDKFIEYKREILHTLKGNSK